MSTKSQLSLLAAMPFVLLTLILVSAPSALGMMADFILFRWYGYQGVPVGFILMLASLTVSLLLYFASLGPMGRLLMAREPVILARFRRDKE